MTEIIEKIMALLSSQEFINIYSIITTTIIPFLVILMSYFQRLKAVANSVNVNQTNELNEIRAENKTLKEMLGDVKTLLISAKNTSEKNLEATAVAFNNSNLDNSVKLEISKITKQAENIDNSVKETASVVKESISKVVEKAQETINIAVAQKPIIKTALDILKEKAGIV